MPTTTMKATMAAITIPAVDTLLPSEDGSETEEIVGSGVAEGAAGVEMEEADVRVWEDGSELDDVVEEDIDEVEARVEDVEKVVSIEEADENAVLRVEDDVSDSL